MIAMTSLVQRSTWLNESLKFFHNHESKTQQCHNYRVILHYVSLAAFRCVWLSFVRQLLSQIVKST